VSDWNGDGPGKRYDLSLLRFIIGSHVEERWNERVDEPFDRERIRQEVFDGWWKLRRASKDKPRWLGAAPNPNYEGVHWFVWTRDLSRAYVVRFNESQPEEILVRTVLIPDVDEPSAWRRELRKWLRRQGEEGPGGGPNA